MISSSTGPSSAAGSHSVVPVRCCSTANRSDPASDKCPSSMDKRSPPSRDLAPRKIPTRSRGPSPRNKRCSAPSASAGSCSMEKLISISTPERQKEKSSLPSMACSAAAIRIPAWFERCSATHRRCSHEAPKPKVSRLFAADDRGRDRSPGKGWVFETGFVEGGGCVDCQLQHRRLLRGARRGSRTKEFFFRRNTGYSPGSGGFVGRHCAG